MILSSRRNKDFVHRTSVFEGAFRGWSYLASQDPCLMEDIDPNDIDATKESKYKFEPLPRSGLSHPYVKAILSQWVGPNANQVTVENGLEILRTWWSHRRRGQSKTALQKLNTGEETKAVVDNYTRHFFVLAHCLVFSDMEAPPQSLQFKMTQSKHLPKTKKSPKVLIRGKCIPGDIDLPSVVGAVKAANVQHYGRCDTPEPAGVPTSMPIVFISPNGDCQIVMDVDGITCAHCVKIVETVLLGCRERESPIAGLLNVAADHALSKLFIKISAPIDAARIAVESSRNLGLVGYTATPKRFPLTSLDEQENLIRLFRQFAAMYPTALMDWNVKCSCPNNGVFRKNCALHSQVVHLQGTFRNYERALREFVGSNEPGEPPLGAHFRLDLDPQPRFKSSSLPDECVVATTARQDTQDESMDPIPFDQYQQQRFSLLEEALLEADFLADFAAKNEHDGQVQRRSSSHMVQELLGEAGTTPGLEPIDSMGPSFFDDACYEM